MEPNRPHVSGEVATSRSLSRLRSRADKIKLNSQNGSFYINGKKIFYMFYIKACLTPECVHVSITVNKKEIR